ncbi:MAG TPA: hypothetical protein VHI93_06530, partial [Candidatus Thermoplasmatota archaeon]|nr:hypothetical protein [Candidatus Thermoplasmatota archaeon]
HRELEVLVAGLATAGPTVQQELGRWLRDHVRFEEDEAFASLQQTLTEAQWADLAARAGAFRSMERPPGDAEECFL